MSIFQRFQKAVRSIEKVVEKIKPFLDKMLELVDAIKKIISIVKQQESMDDMKDNDVAKLKLPSEYISIFLPHNHNLMVLPHFTEPHR